VTRCQSRNSPGEWAAQGPPPGQDLAIQLSIRQTIKLLVLLVGRRTERRRERLPGLLLERRTVQCRERQETQVEVQVEVKVRIQVRTHEPTQAGTRLRTLLHVLPDGPLRVLRGGHQWEVRALGVGAAGDPVRRLQHPGSGCDVTARSALRAGFRCRIPPAFVGHGVTCDIDKGLRQQIIMLHVVFPL
jgi:hypothetical protein